jgi:hypothetical protein
LCESLVEFEELVGKLRKTNTNDSPSSLFLSRHVVTLIGRLQESGLSMINILNERETSDRKRQQKQKELEMFIFALVFEQSFLAFQEFSYSEVRLQLWRS